MYINVSEESVEVKLPKIRTDEKAEVGRVIEKKRREGKGREGKRREEERRSGKRKSQKKEDAGARKSRKVAIRCIFQWSAAPEGRKIAGRCGTKRVSKSKFTTNHTTIGSLLEVGMSKKRTPLWRETNFEVKMGKPPQNRTTFRNWAAEQDVEKVHAVVARSPFPSQNVQSTTCPDHFWRFRCGFPWQAQGILHLAKSEQNVRVL